uniref:Alternative protein IFT172 n=1 Tax=Homo sapiens TaxID=9606 RepID=L8E9V2_HUMAN|nr:alternative protein IFT172 [Homo sapiens]
MQMVPSLGISLMMKALESHRGSWLTTRVHPMPWHGQPIASWLQAVIGKL